MSFVPRFLVIDDRSDSRLLLVRTLLRKFPAALVEEWFEDTPPVTYGHTAVVAHRTGEISGLELVQAIRARNPVVPLVLVWNAGARELALASGANSVLPLDEWLRLGTVVAELLGIRAPANPLSLPDTTEPEPAPE